MATSSASPSQVSSSTRSRSRTGRMRTSSIITADRYDRAPPPKRVWRFIRAATAASKPMPMMLMATIAGVSSRIRSRRRDCPAMTYRAASRGTVGEPTVRTKSFPVPAGMKATGVSPACAPLSTSHSVPSPPQATRRSHRSAAARASSVASPAAAVTRRLVCHPASWNSASAASAAAMARPRPAFGLTIICTRMTGLFAGGRAQTLRAGKSSPTGEARVVVGASNTEAVGAAPCAAPTPTRWV